MIRRLALAVTLASSSASIARADDARRMIGGDAAAVFTLRPVAAQAALGRLGSGWDALLRRGLPIPRTVSPLDPATLSTLGLDPASTAWASLRALRGHPHLRVALPLAEPRIAEALVQTGAKLAGVTLERQAGAWLGRHPQAGSIVIRLQGTVLVADLLLSKGTAPLLPPAALAKQAPLSPAAPFDPARHGSARRLEPADAAALWVDLRALAALGLLEAEAGPAKSCRAALRDAPASFDDALAAIVVADPSSLGLEIALGARHGALAQGPHPIASRRLSSSEASSELSVSVVDPAPLQCLVRAPSVPAPVSLPPQCPALSRTAIALRSGPAMIAADLARPERTSELDRALLRLVPGIRGLSLTLPSPSGPRDDNALGPHQLITLVELDDHVRAELDRVLSGRYTPTSPLRIGPRQLSAYASQGFAWSNSEPMLVAIDPIGDPPGGSVVGLGLREGLRSALERVGRGAASGPADPGLIASARASARMVARLLRDLGGGPLADGVGAIDAALSLDDDLLELRATVALAPKAP